MTAPSNFVWYELITSDAPAAADFYQKVVGWSVLGPDKTGMDYSIFQVGDHGEAGLTAFPEIARQRGARPAWIGYIGVDDVDAYTARVIERGGAQRKAPADIPGVGRSALLSDPQGATFALFKPLDGMAPARDRSGHARPGRLARTDGGGGRARL